jgi:hypothetical protein
MRGLSQRTVATQRSYPQGRADSPQVGLGHRVSRAQRLNPKHTEPPAMSNNAHVEKIFDLEN